MTERSKSRGEKAITNLFTSVIAWGWPIGLAFVITPLLVRGLGADAYGMRGLIFTITGYFALLDLGLNAAGTKYLAEYYAISDNNAIRDLIGTTLSTFLLLGLAGCLIIWFTAPWVILNYFKVPSVMQEESIWALRLSGFGFIFSMLIWWASSVPTGLQRFDIFNWISVGFGTITSLGSLAAVWLGQGLIGVVWANVLANVIAFSAYLIVVRCLLKDVPIRPSFNWQMFRRTVLFGIWSVLFRLVGVMVTQLDRIFIGMWLGMAPLTYFLIPNQVAAVIQQISGKMMQIVFPMASEFSAAKSVDKLKLLVLRSINLTTVVAIGLGLPIIVLARPLMAYWMGEGFADQSCDVLQLMVVAYCLSTLTAAPSSILPGLGQPQVVFYAAVISSVFLLPSYFLFIRPLGITGVAWAYIVSAVPVIIFYAILTIRATGTSLCSILKVFIKPLLIGSGIGFLSIMIVVPIVNNLIGVLITATVLLLVYATAVWFAGVFDSNEKVIIKSFILRNIAF